MAKKFYINYGRKILKASGKILKGKTEMPWKLQVTGKEEIQSYSSFLLSII